MGERNNTQITIQFNYSLPDDYLYQTDNKKLTGSCVYEGPNKIWVFVNTDSGKLVNSLYYTEKDDGDEIPTPSGTTKVCIVAETYPELIHMITSSGYFSGPTKTELLPDGSEYVRHDPTPPDHTYELMEIEYDLEKNIWKKPYPWKKPHMDWDTLKLARNAMLRESDQIIRNNILTAEQTTQIEDYRQKLRDLPTLFNGIDPWKVPFPNMPLEL